MTQDDGGSKQLSMDSRLIARGLLHPSTLLLLAANSLPIFGVLYWGWDVFVLLMLYWLETAVIGFWMIVRIAIAPPGALGTMEVNGRQRLATSLFVVCFFLVHGGIFMVAHFAFLWSLFSGDWAEKIHGLADFVNKLVIGTNMWITLLALFVVRGLGFVIRVWNPRIIQALARSLHLPMAAPEPPPAEEFGSIVGAFYSRVIIMHLTIIGSGFLALAFGTVTPLVIMVLIKTVTDVKLHLKFDFGDLKKSSQTLTAVTSQ